MNCLNQLSTFFIQKLNGLKLENSTKLQHHINKTKNHSNTSSIFLWNFVQILTLRLYYLEKIKFNFFAKTSTKN